MAILAVTGICKQIWRHLKWSRKRRFWFVADFLRVLDRFFSRFWPRTCSFNAKTMTFKIWKFGFWPQPEPFPQRLDKKLEKNDFLTFSQKHVSRAKMGRLKGFCWSKKCLNVHKWTIWTKTNSKNSF